MPKIFLSGIFLLLLTQCASQPENGETKVSGIDPSQDNGKQTTPAGAFDASPAFKQAETFNKFLKNQLSGVEIKAERDNCRKSPTENPFCYTWIRSKPLEKLIALRNRPPVFPEPKVVTPIVIEVVNQRVKNANKIRKEKIPQLIKGMEGTTIEQVRNIARAGMKIKRCPNNIPIVAAATLEDYLPNNVSPAEIADLYENGGRCAARNSPDREHFYTRAGLLHYYAKNYAKAARLLSKVRPSSAYSGRALYWKFRTYQAMGDQKKADKALKELFGNFKFSFHAVIASFVANRERAPEFLVEKSFIERRSKWIPAMNKLIEQIEILKGFQFGPGASLLAEWALDRHRKVEPGVKVYVLTLADPSLQVLNVSDLLLRKPKMVSRETMQLLFPKAYPQVFQSVSSTIDPYLMLAVARKESRFDPNAVSIANAQGLLQLQPQTAAKVTGKSDLNLLDPEVNVTTAAKYLNEVLSRVGGKLPLALASYNAGEDPVKVWTQRYMTSDPILFIDLIPYRETRDYVGSVLANYYWYRKTYDPASPDPVKPILQTELATKN